MMIEGVAALQCSGRVLSVGCEVVTEKNLDLTKGETHRKRDAATATV